MRVFYDSILPSWAALHSISELFIPGSLFSSSPDRPRFDPTEATIQSVHQALYSNVTVKEDRITCREVVTAFLNQIETYNPLINAIISLDVDSLSVADGLDERLLQVLNESTQTDGNDTHNDQTSVSNASTFDSSLPPLFCIPILLKDNFDTANVSTTGGCAALSNSTPPLHDAPVVKALRDAGAVILGKTNMHEMALEGLTVSSLGGQTLNPYDLSRTPGGSSGGTGAAVAASFAVFGLGTDTVNSIRSPASANSLFSLRPTQGLISRAGVLPVSYTQDTVGPIARCVWDLAVSLNVMTMGSDGWYDGRDNMTASRPRHVRGLDYTDSLAPDEGLYKNSDLKGIRFGVLTGLFNRTDNPETTPVNEAVDAMVSKLEDAGAIMVPITESIYNSTAILNLDLQAYEYREMVDSYFQNLHHQRGLLSWGADGQDPPHTLTDIYTKISEDDPSFLVIPHQYGFIKAALISSPQDISYAQNQLSINALRLSVKQTFASHNLDALIYPQQQNLPVKLGSRNQYGRNGILAALTGNPVITIPAGFSKGGSRNTPIGVPVGMELMGLSWEEERLLSIAARIEALEKVRRAPILKAERGRGGSYSQALSFVPGIVPNTRDIHDVYPRGVFE
ncbi:hypothetical protein FQN49_000318 [Arthroderma sp. PD_2]|nr:hypothetical protein FQN49_000318 [Arthroderma sp. PD_2]